MASADPWPPTLPEFRARCLGIPNVASVRLDSTKVEPFTLLVWQYLNTYRYRMVSADQADRMLKEAYELAREHVMRGGALPQPSSGEIEHQKSEIKLADPEKAAAAMAAIAKELGIRESDE